MQDSKQLEELERYFHVGSSTCYIGCRRRTREVLQKHMYNAEIRKWLADADELETCLDFNRMNEAAIESRLIES